jgi:hypothetical protein
LLINYVFIAIEYKVWKNDNSDIYSINVIDEKWIVVPLDNIDYKKIENDLINGNLKTEDLGKFQIEIYETTKRYQDEIELHNSETRSFIKLNSKSLRYKREEIETENSGNWFLDMTKIDNILYFFKQYIDNSGKLNKV